MEIKNVNTFLKAIIIVIIVAVIDFLGWNFIALKTVSIPFVPNRNIDQMSDFYTSVWQSNSKEKIIDNGRFLIVDVADYSHRDIAEILKAVSSMNPKIIGLDVMFISEDDPAEDSLLVETILSIPNIILPIEYIKNKEGKDTFEPSIFYNRLKDKCYGVVSFPNNRDVIRVFTPSFKIDNNTFESFGCVIANKCGLHLPDIDSKKEIIINYTTLQLGDDERLPGSQFLNMNQQERVSLASETTGKIVLIGATKHTDDQHLTPLGNSLSGVMIHAHIINSLIENRVIHSLPVIVRYLLCLILAIAVIMWNKKTKKSEQKRRNIWITLLLYSGLFMISVILFACIGTFLFCRYNYYIDFSPYIVTIIIANLLKNKSITFSKP